MIPESRDSKQVYQRVSNSLCRGGADMPMPPYIKKVFTHKNIEDLVYK